MAFLSDLLFSAIGAHQANQQYQSNIADYTSAQNQAIAGYAPYAAVGTQAAGNVGKMLTPGFQFSPTDPSYNFRLNQGIQAGDRSAAANGSLLSGGQQKALSDYGQNAASTEYGAEFNRNAGVAQTLGMGAAGADASALFAGTAGRAQARNSIAGNNQGFWGGVAGSFNSAAASAFSPTSVVGFGGKSWGGG